MIGRLSLLVATLLVVTSCGRDAPRPGTEPYAPLTPDYIAGSYSATRMIVERDGHITELIGDPDTRLDIRLNTNGSVHGQLKIGADPELRDKRSLVGTWQLHVPGWVSFKLRPNTFLNETTFQIRSPGLVGEWMGEGVHLRVDLARID